MQSIDTFATHSPSLEGRQARPDGGGDLLRGQMGGQEFIVESEASALGDAAEEISLHYAEKAESKHTAERKKEVAKPPALMSPEAIESLIEETEGESEGRRKLQDFARRVIAASGSAGQLASASFTRPSGQLLALQYALQQGEKEGASEAVLADLREAIEDLSAEHGPRIRADLNTIGVAREGARGPVDVAQFQSTYEDLVLGKGTLSSSLELVLDKFGESGFTVGLERLKRALGQDLASARPSTDAAHLESLVQDLYHLGVTSTILDGCRDLKAELSARYGTSLALMDPVPLTKELVRLSGEKWVSAGTLVGLAERSGARDVEPQINFLTSIKNLLREMPPQIFVDGDQRQRVLSAVQEALDMAIDREEE